MILEDRRTIGTQITHLSVPQTIFQTVIFVIFSTWTNEYQCVFFFEP